MTGARRHSDDTDRLPRNRSTCSNGSPPDAAATFTPFNARSRFHGWKRTDSTVTSRPSNADTRVCNCHLSSGGTASHSTAHSSAMPPAPQVRRLIQSFFMAEV